MIGASVIREPQYAEQVLEEEKCDFIGSARTFFADPDWAVKAGKEEKRRSANASPACTVWRL